MRRRDDIIWDPPKYPSWAAPINEGAISVSLISENESSETDYEPEGQSGNTTAGAHSDQSEHSEHGEANAVEWIELLFDLIFVIAIANITELFAEAALASLSLQERELFTCIDGHGSSHGIVNETMENEVHDSNHDNNNHESHEPGLFGMSAPIEDAFSAVFYFLLITRIWHKETLLQSSQKGGLDALGRIRVFLLMWTFSGITVFMGKSLRSEFNAALIFEKYTIACLWQFLGYARYYYHSIEIRRAWGWSLFFELAVELGLFSIISICSRVLGEDFDINVRVIFCLVAFFSVYVTRLVCARHGTLSSVLATTNLHHYAERYGLLVVILMGECFVQLRSGHDRFEVLLSNEAKLKVEQSSFWMTLLSYVILCSFFWMYFDNSNPNAWQGRRASMHAIHTFMIFGLSAIGAALNILLVHINCFAYLNELDGVHGVSRHVPLVVSLLFSTALASTTFFQGLIALLTLKNSNDIAAEWQSSSRHAKRSHGFNLLRSLMLLMLPLFAGLDTASPEVLIILAAILLVMMVVGDIVCVRQLQSLQMPKLSLMQ